MSQGPPYAPKTAGLGGVPTVTLDDPIIAVFLFLYVCGAATHMTIFQLNSKKGHKFIASGALFGFCMARITACVLRLVWSTHTRNIRVVIAANVFINAGVLIVIILNLIFAQRILRASHPHIGWHRSIHFAFLAFYLSIILLLGGLITALVQQVYTLDTHIQNIDRIIQLVGVTYFAVASFVPILIVVGGLIIPKKTRVEKFGSGRFRTKIHILLISSSLITLGAAFRAAVAYMPRPVTNPAWYHSKAAFYCFNFAIEIIVIFLYAIVRVDRRFWIPNGSHAPGHYSAGVVEKEDEERPRTSTGVFSEEELMDDVTEEDNDKDREWEKRAEEERSHGIEGAPAVRAA